MKPERAVLVAAILSSFVAFLDGSIVNVALPAISRELGGGIITQQWVLDGYLLALGSLILIAGSLSDTFGRVRVLRAGLILFGIASIACALAPTAELLIAARVLQGVGAALLVPSSLALITSTFSGPAQGAAIGTWTAWTGTAFIAGPLLGGLLVDTVGWRWIFAINVLPIAITLLVLLRVPPSRRPVDPPPIDWLGAGLAALGLAGTVFALIEQQRLGWASPVVLIPLIVGVLALAAFLWWQSRARHPLVPLGLFRVRNFGFGNLATTFIYAGVSLGILVVTLFLQEVVGLPATLAGLATLPVAIASLLLARVFGMLAGRHGPRLFMTIGPLVAAAGYLWMLQTREPVDFWWQLLPGLILYGLGLAITVAPLTAAVLGSIPPAQSGIASAINNAVSRIAGLIAVAFAGTIVGGALGYGGFRRAMLVTALLFAVGGVVSWFGIRNRTVAAVSAPDAAACADRPTAGAGATGSHPTID